MTDRTTKDLILDTAERRFAEDGFAATSLRAIIKEAGVNTAAVHYHFGSKEDLIHAVIARRVDPVNRRRLEMLERFEAAAAPGAVPVEQIVDAFLRPAIEIQHATPEDAEVFRKLVGRVTMDATIEQRGRIGRLFEGVASRFTAALKAALPDLGDPEMFWRVHFMVGAMTFAISMPHGEKCPAHMDAAGDSPGELREQLVQFIVGGLTAPTTVATKEEQR